MWPLKPKIEKQFFFPQFIIILKKMYFGVIAETGEWLKFEILWIKKQWLWDRNSNYKSTSHLKVINQQVTIKYLQEILKNPESWTRIAHINCYEDHWIYLKFTSLLDILTSAYSNSVSNSWLHQEFDTEFEWSGFSSSNMVLSFIEFAGKL